MPASVALTDDPYAQRPNPALKHPRAQEENAAARGGPARTTAAREYGAGLRARLAWFASRGWPLFALTGSKRPYAGCRSCPRAGHDFAACPHPPAFCHGHLAASLDAVHLERLWRRRPDSVPGISLGPARLLVLDADSAAHGQLTAAPWTGMAGIRDGIDVLRDVFARHGHSFPPADTLQVATPSRGVHLYYRLPKGVEVLSKPLVAGALLDVKSRGGYVVAPGSASRGGTYRRIGAVAWPREAPGWLLAYLASTGHIPTRTPRPATASTPYPVSRQTLTTADAVARRVERIRGRLAGCRSGRHAAIATASTALAHLVADGQLTEGEAHAVLIEAAVTAYQGTEVSARRAERDARDAFASALRRAGA